MKVVFRVDASTQMGTGHLMRCLSLAQAITAVGATAVFFVNSSTTEICVSRLDWVGQLKCVPEGLTQQEEVIWLSSQPEIQSADGLVLDGYQFSADYRLHLSRGISCPLIVFDDLNDSGPLHADVVINYSETASQLGYEVTAPGAELLLGNAYRTLRSEFYDIDLNDWASRRYLLITMGGSDPANVTVPLVDAFGRLKAAGALGEMPIRVLLGPAFARKDSLAKVLQHHDIAVEVVSNSQDIARMMSETRLAISAAGGSQYELQFSGTPSVLTIVAGNQKGTSQSSNIQSWAQVHSLEKNGQLDELAKKATRLWYSESQLQQMHQNALQHGFNAGRARMQKALMEVMSLVPQHH